MPYSTLRLLKYTTLCSLPVTLLPILHALVSGFLWGPWSNNHFASNAETFFHEAKASLSDWGAGGDAPTFGQFQDTNNDFHLTRINTHDWLRKLGYVLPTEFTDFDGNAGIDKVADLGHLMQDTACGNATKEQWLYLTNFAWSTFNKWNVAYNEILQMAYVHPVLNQSSYHFAECMSGARFLCGVWATRAPALVHFLTGDEALDPKDIKDGLTYTAPPERLRPVAARIIELPLEEAYTGLSPATFPSEKEQMLAIMVGDRLYEQWEPFNVVLQISARFQDYLDRIYDAEGTFLHYLDVADDWVREQITEPTGLDYVTESLRKVVFLVTMVISTLIWSAMTLANDLVGAFLARPSRGDEILAGVSVEKESDDTFWDDFMAGLAEFANQKRAEIRSLVPDESAQEMPITAA